MLGDLHPTQTFSVFRFSLCKDIHSTPKIKGCVLPIWVLYDTLEIIRGFAPLLRLLFKPVFSRYFRNFLVTTPSAEMTMAYTDTLLNFEILFIPGVKFSCFLIFSVSVLIQLGVKETVISIKVLFIIIIIIIIVTLLY